MTTLVYRAGVLAADTEAHANNWRPACRVRKVWRCSDGRLLGMTGAAAEGTMLAMWLRPPPDKRKGPKPDVRDEARVVEVAPNGKVTIHEGAGSFPVFGPFHAWGSGFPAALAAMHMGADAVTAVRIAALVDPSTGRHVMSVRHERVKEA